MFISFCSFAHLEFEKAELLLYEEVARMPPFERKTVVLVGARGVGRRSLKNKLISYDPARFGTPLPRKLLSVYVLCYVRAQEHLRTAASKFCFQ